MQTFASADDVAIYSKGAISPDDPRLERALEGMSAAVRRYCGWHIAPIQEETVLLDGPGGRLLGLPSLNVTNIESIVENGFARTDYRWSADGSVKRSGGYWSDEFRDISITFSHGYDLDDVPDVRDVVIAAVTREMSSPTGATRESVGAVSMSWAITASGSSGGVALLQNERDVLDHFRIEAA